MNLTAFSLLANSNPEIDENQEVELTFGSLNFYMGPSGTTRLSDSTKSVSSAGKAESMIESGSSVGSSSEANSPVGLAATENLQGKLEEPDEIRQETRVEEAVDKVKGYRQQKQRCLQERTPIMRYHHRSSRRRKQSHWQQGGRYTSRQIKEQ
jgi:hypothetical protein